MEVDCLNCPYDHICCTKFGVTLTREEIGKFTHVTIARLTENNVPVGYTVSLQKKSNGSCFYQDDLTGLCTIYEERPQACRNFNCAGRL